MLYVTLSMSVSLAVPIFQTTMHPSSSSSTITTSSARRHRNVKSTDEFFYVLLLTGALLVAIIAGHYSPELVPLPLKAALNRSSIATTTATATTTTTAATATSLSATTNNKQRVLAALEALERSVTPRLQRAAVGTNSNVDLIAQAGLESLRAAGVDASLVGRDHAFIETATQLGELHAQFFRIGAACERFVADQPLFAKLVEAARTQAGSEFAVGGNAPLMSQRLAAHGVSVLLGGQVGAALRPLLHHNVHTVPAGNVDAAATATDDEVHLILEYKAGSTWGSLTAPRANRLILAHDRTNSALRPWEAFAAAVRASLALGAANGGVQLVVATGLHLLEGEPAAVRAERLALVAADLAELSTRVPVHLELASTGDAGYLAQLATTLLPRVSSIGLNEQELYALYSALGGVELSRAAFARPQVDDVTRALEFVLRSPVVSAETALLDRIHFHCLQFHIIALRTHQRGTAPPLPGSHDEGDNSAFRWRTDRASAAVAAGSLTATRQACHTGALRVTDLNLPLSDFTLPQWPSADGAFSFHLAPVFECRKPLKTVGLGDAISAVGLLYSF